MADGREPTAGGELRVLGPVEVLVLGPVEVRGPTGRAAVLSGSRQRALVGLLSLPAGTVVTPARLIDAMWGEDPPRTALKTLYSHVTRVRQALAECGLPDALTRQGSGYLLTMPRAAVDAHRFEEQVRQGGGELAEGAVGPAVERLRAALGLWRGEPLADAEPAGWAVAEVARLQELRLTALEDRWDGELRLGRHRPAVGELERLVAGHPYRERLVGLHMLALYRCARHAEALEAYRRLRAGLAEELGIDPDGALQRLHADILRRSPGLELPGGWAPSVAAGDDGTAHGPGGTGQGGGTTGQGGGGTTGHGGRGSGPRPAQLPALVGHFTGRADELAALEGVARGRARDGHIVVVSGPAGMGKTALAVQFAHRVRDLFPDGQLFLDLRGHDPAAAMTAGEALCQVLRSLGVPTERIPAEPVEQAGLYRSLVVGRRMLVVLDNAGGVDQLLPLVPATATSLVLITSRTRLTGLGTWHAIRSVTLDVLARPEAVALLKRVAGHDRPNQPDLAGQADPTDPTDPIAGLAGQADPAALAGLAELAELCGRMPLALRIAGAKLAADPHRTVAELVTELTTEDRLDALSVAGDSRSVRTVFASAYRGLSGSAARAFRLIGLHPGPSVSAHLVAAGCGSSLGRARAALAELAGAHLVGAVGGRYRCHDLIRLYALECAQTARAAGGPETAGGAARTPDLDDAPARIVDWYLAVADLANRTVDRGRDRVTPTLRHPLTEPPFAPETQAALVFLDGERENMIPIVRYAAEHGHPAAAWQLTYLLTGFFDSRGYWQDRVELCRWGLAGAQRDGGPSAEGLMHSALGVALIATRRFDEALDVLHRALPLMRACGDRRGEGHVQNNIAVAYGELRNFDSAIETLEHAVAAHTASGHTLGIALALSNRGDFHTQMGEPELALTHLRRALELVRALGNPRLEAIVRSRLGQAHLRRGDHDAARRHLTEALGLRRRAGDRRHEADTLNDLGLVCLLGQDRPGALAHLERAFSLGREIADPHLEAIAVNRIGRIHLELGEWDRARERLDLALALRTRVPDRYEEANIHRDLGDLAHRTGDAEAGVGHWRRAIELYRKANAWGEAELLSAAAPPALAGLPAGEAERSPRSGSPAAPPAPTGAGGGRRYAMSGAVVDDDPDGGRLDGEPVPR